MGDYALSVARALHDHHGINSHFIVPGADGNISPLSSDFPPIGLSDVDGENLANVLESNTSTRGYVLLHYSGYGYDKNGIPRRLIEELRHWKHMDSRRRLVTVFHELYATSWPWRRAFWFSLQQQNVAKKLSLMSDRCVTTRTGYAAIVKRWRNLDEDADAVLAVPIPSSVGEPSRNTPLSKRRAVMVVFGSSSSRTRVYREASQSLWQACELLGTNEVLDIGPGEPQFPVPPPHINIRRKGILTPDQVDRMLSACRAGFVNYNPAYLAKSSIFAAYCAHGLVPVIAARSSVEEDGLFVGRHYWHPGLGCIDLSRMQAIAEEAFAWYSGHTTRVHAHIFNKIIGSFE